MRKFQFKLQNLLNIKEKLEDQQKLVYAEILESYKVEEAILESLCQKRDNYNRKLKTEVAKRSTAAQFKLHYIELNKINEMCLIQKQKLLKVEKKLEEARVKMNEAIIERKTYEKLKDNALNKHLKEEEKKEQTVLDELISYKYNKPDSWEVNYGK